jgi:DNA-binding NarL/FixJ family response regulator
MGGAKTIRILLASLPTLLREVVEAVLAREPDFVILEAPASPGSLADLAEALRPDVIITGASSTCPAPRVVRLFEGSPRLKVFCVAASGSDVDLLELRPEQQSLGELAPRDLVGAIRGAVRTPFSMIADPRQRPSG